MLRKLSLTVTLLAILGGIAGQTAQAHFLPHKRNLSLDQRISYYKRSIHHDQTAIVWLTNARANMRQNLRSLSSYPSAVAAISREAQWHRAALRWYRDLLSRAEARWKVLHPPPPPLPPHYADWLCIHSHEATWTDTGAPYWGGLQFGYSEWHTYGTPYTHVDTANLATPLEQMWAAERYWDVSGFSPWPNTARMCGLL